MSVNPADVLLLAYAFRSARPSHLGRFRRLAQVHGRLGGMTAACFLCYQPQNKVDMSVRRLLFDTMPRLLPQLSRATHPQREVLCGRTRGRIDWASTYKVRYSADSNPTVFVCQQTWRHFDRLENQLVKFLLHQIQVCLDRVPPGLRTWFAWGALVHGGAGEPIHVGNELATLAHRLRVLSNNVYLREVTLPTAIDSRHVLAARTHKNELYSQIADLYDLYTEVIEVSKWDKWAEVLNQTAPFLSPNADKVARPLILAT